MSKGTKSPGFGLKMSIIFPESSFGRSSNRCRKSFLSAKAGFILPSWYSASTTSAKEVDIHGTVGVHTLNISGAPSAMDDQGSSEASANARNCAAGPETLYSRLLQQTNAVIPDVKVAVDQWRICCLEKAWYAIRLHEKKAMFRTV